MGRRVEKRGNHGGIRKVYLRGLSFPTLNFRRHRAGILREYIGDTSTPEHYEFSMECSIFFFIPRIRYDLLEFYTLVISCTKEN